ncbi:MAG TPA: class I SAM-dependent methyltransferase [bacterium]|nr:class I SAM-dependent methyltransferase [bacterium]
MKRTSLRLSPHLRPHFHLKDFPGFSPQDLLGLERYYNAQLKGHLAPEKRVGWNSAHSQRVRFETLASIGPLDGTKILDIGCGLGGFWGYLREKKVKVDYTGIDLFPNVIREARKLHPDVKFQVRRILSKPFRAGSFDYCFLSGVFNVKVKDNWRYMKAVLSAALRQSRKAVAFNALNAEAGIKEKDRFTTYSKELAAFGKSLGVSRVHLMDHYHHLDLTLFLYK